MTRDKTTTFFYLRDEYNHPYAAVAFKLDGDNLKVAYSVCRPEEEFTKRHARNKALGRLQSKSQFRVLPASTASLSRVFRASLYYDFPNREQNESLFRSQVVRLQEDNKAA